MLKPMMVYPGKRSLRVAGIASHTAFLAKVWARWFFLRG